MLIVTNFVNFPQQWTATDGTAGRTEFAKTTSEFLRFRDHDDAVFVVNGSARIALELALRQLLPFKARRPLIAVDMVLRKPNTARATLSVVTKRIVFRNVDYFVHYFKDLHGLDSLYGIGADRSGFVDFKANLWNRRAKAPQPDGEYVLCFGRSLRDFDTFFDAIETTNYPGAIVDPHSAAVWEHGSRFTRSLEDLPANVRVLEHDQSNESQANLLDCAKIVVVPMVIGRLVSPISTIMNSMILGKCVVATAGPGVSDLFGREVLSVPAEDPAALASTITTAWTDDHLRCRTAEAGWKYALRCGSEQDFYGRLTDALVEWHARH